jgi:TonB family protein
LEKPMEVFLLVLAVFLSNSGCSTKGRGDDSTPSGAPSFSGPAFWLSGELSTSDITNSMMPKYSHSASSHGINTLTVTFDFSVDSDGNVRPDITVARTTGSAVWDEDVKNTLSRWKFKPAPGVEIRKGTISFRIARPKILDE